jgi:hypothetical protein
MHTFQTGLSIDKTGLFFTVIMENIQHNCFISTNLRLFVGKNVFRSSDFWKRKLKHAVSDIANFYKSIQCNLNIFIDCSINKRLFFVGLFISVFLSFS